MNEKASFYRKMMDMKLAINLMKNCNDIVEKHGTIALMDWDYLSIKKRKETVFFLEEINKLATYCEFHILFSRFYNCLK